MEIKERPYTFTIKPETIPGLLIGAGVLVGENFSRLEEYNASNWMNDFDYSPIEKDVSGLEKFLNPSVRTAHNVGEYLDRMSESYTNISGGLGESNEIYQSMLNRAYAALELIDMFNQTQ